MANEIEQLNSEIEQLAKRVEQLKNVNILTKEKYDEILDLAINELYAVETPTVVETYSDDDGNWYRVYSDGWVEQGGKPVTQTSYNEQTITFLKPFDNLNYTFLVTQAHTSGLDESSYIKQKKLTSIIVSNVYNSNGLANWCAFGQGE